MSTVEYGSRLVKANRTLTSGKRKYWKDVILGRREAEIEEPISEVHRIINSVPQTPNSLHDCMRVAGTLMRVASENGKPIDLTQDTLPPSARNRLPHRWRNPIEVNGGIRLLPDTYGTIAELVLQNNGKKQ